MYFHPANLFFLFFIGVAIYVTVAPLTPSKVIKGPQLYLLLFSLLGGFVVRSFLLEPWALAVFGVAAPL